ncbi:late competence protein [Streptococcus australis]|uniref:ComF family protein n=1 Tax=Streptococcus australis ATCC 700641 TaxID=888833 RepID=E7SD10_9STRE|nr:MULTISPECIES: ComF family protein [Streptococcus]EFV98486.1 comF family protein [Streptococcus australis ATCC 700641]SQH65876.1 late competence protein [Streptococcus australis]
MKKENLTMCDNCKNKFEPVSEASCKTCCKKSSETSCEDCQEWERKGKSVNHKALYYYNEEMKEYFQKYKFQGDQLLACLFAEEIKVELKKYKGYTIVPIPLSDERNEKRGFNQVTAILESAGIPHQHLLIKKNTKAQSQKNKKERLKTEQAFRRKEFENKSWPEKIMIVDDIYTTGATIERAKEMLNVNGVKEIRSFTLAR